LQGSLRIALLSYRGDPQVGGQGVYVRQLAAGLNALGHRVTIFSGPPYPDVSEGVRLEHVPSLDLYRPADPFRRPALREFRGPVDALEYALMCTGAFPEPLTFSLRMLQRIRAGDFDVVHDNQTLGYGGLLLAKRGPFVTTIHHPISIDRRMALASAGDAKERATKRRWYSFVRMQRRVAKRSPSVLAVSESAARDVVREFEVPARRVSVVPNGVDVDLFKPLPDVARRAGKIVATLSSDMPSKGLSHLIEAVAKLRTERDVTLTLIGKGGVGVVAEDLVRRFGIEAVVETPGRVDALDLVRHLNEASVVVVPSLYEGFSLPAVEAMSCGAPLVATTGGAIPEVVGGDGVAALLVPPADAGALAEAICRLLDDSVLAEALGGAGRSRVLERFTWKEAARLTTDVYRQAIEGC
jgi:glycosyltransferase involved in cell wall biosynthesis